MEGHGFLIILLLILVSSRIFAELFSRLGLPPVLGELLAGIVIGPSLFGWVSIDKTIVMLAEIGIILLLFDVGLETDIKRLKDSGRDAFFVAVGGFFLPFLIGSVVSYYIFELSLIVSMFIGGTITATSIGITVRVLKDLNRHKSKEGETVLGAAVLDDILGVVLLAILYDFSKTGEVHFADSFKVLLFITIFFITAPIAAKLIASLIDKHHAKTEYPGLIPVSIISLVLFFAWLAHELGAPEIIGGFAAGLALSRRFFLPFGVAIGENKKFAHKIEKQMKPIIYLFTPIFFVSVGLSVNMKEIDWSSFEVWIFAISILIVSIVGKMIVPLFMKSLPKDKRIIIGLSMIPRGEVGLIFAEMGKASGIFDAQIYASIILVIIVTTLLPPILIKMAYKKNETIASNQTDQAP